jgi:hypothetical protein
MITMTTFYEDADGNCTLEFPELETINLGDPEIQKQLIKWGVAVGIPGGEFAMVKSTKLLAGDACE